MKTFRMAYFANFAYLGVFAPFWTFFLKKSLGFDEFLVGSLHATFIVSGLASAWILAYAADARGNRQAIQRWTSLGTFACCLAWGVEPTLVPAFALAAVHGFCWGVHIPLLDATTVDYLGGSREGYGRLRLFGTVGFGVAVLAMGLLLEEGRASIPWVMAGWAVAFHAAVRFLPDSQRPPAGDRPPLTLTALGGKGPVFVLFGGSFLHAVAFGGYESFATIHFDNIGISPTGLGVLVVAAMVAESIVFFHAAKLLARFPAGTLIGIAFGATAFRWFVMSQTSDFTVLILLQTFHAFTFGLWYACTIHLLVHMVDPRIRNTGQVLLSTCFASGMGTGALIAGWSRTSADSHEPFVGSAIISLAAAVVVVCGRRALDGAPTRKSESSNAA